MSKDQNRSANVDVLKFIAALFIMISHIDIVLNNQCFNDFWIYVEMFFMITGYFTANHFDEYKGYNIRECIQYSINKFVPMFPYIIIQVSLMYFCFFGIRLLNHEISIKEMLTTVLNNYFSEILLVSVSYGKPLSGQLWFVSAMFIVFPLFCLFVQIRNRYTIIMTSSLVSMMYYGINENIANDTRGVMALARAVAGLCLGTMIFEWNKIAQKNIRKKTLTIIEVVTFVLPILVIIYGISAYRFVLLCFIIQLSISLSGISYSNCYTKETQVKITNFLGRLSVPLYVFHVLIGSIVQRLSTIIEMSQFETINIYFTGTFFFSVVIMLLFENISFLRNIMNWKAELSDYSQQ